MAELAKMLHFLKNGTEQTARAYSTVDEACDNYVKGKIDGVACYIPLGATNDDMATNGRVIKGGTTYAIKEQSKPAYTEVKYTTAGTHTFTVPSGVTRMRVAVCGGGGGGCTNFENPPHQQGASSKRYYGGNGGDSSFGTLITATGGSAGSCNTKCTFYDGDGFDFVNNGYAGAGGTPNGNQGTLNSNRTGTATGGAGFLLSFTKTSGTYGQGGNAPNTNNGNASGPGGSGGYNSAYITVTSNATYTITVGAGGTANSYSSKYKATAGNSGFVFIAYGGDI
jgi:hypothetical protein